MRRSKAEKLLIKYYKEEVNLKPNSKRNNILEPLLKVAMIICFSLIIFIPFKDNSKLNLSQFMEIYEDDLNNIKNNFSIER